MMTDDIEKWADDHFTQGEVAVVVRLVEEFGWQPPAPLRDEPMPLTIQPPSTTPSLWFVDDGTTLRLDDVTNHGLQPRQLYVCRALLEVARRDIDTFIEDL